MRAFIWSAFTGRDNASVDIGRVLWFMTHVFHNVMTGFAIFAHGQTFDPMSYSGATAAISTSFGAVLMIKKSTEPGG